MGKKWSSEAKARNRARIDAMKVAVGGASTLEDRPAGSGVRDAVVYLKQAEFAVGERMRTAKRPRLSRPELYALLALDALAGGP
jgi:hypothetical protein